MNRILILIICTSVFDSFCQSFAPAPGQPGSTAIHKDSSVIINWANGIEIQRGYLNIANQSLGFASYGENSFALGAAEGDGTSVVSLGDSGVAILTFSNAIINLAGPDFAVFENGFTDDYTEFAHVEVSSDGINFFRFPSVSETPLDSQIDNFTFSDCRYVNNLAGKYRQGYGTPFDLEELVDSIGLDVNAVTHVRLIDIIGSIDPAYGTVDSQGNLINDPYPTEFPSGGFDLDAVAVLHEAPVGINELTSTISIFPNPCSGALTIHCKGETKATIYSLPGQELFAIAFTDSKVIDLSEFSENLVLLELISNDKRFVKRISILH